MTARTDETEEMQIATQAFMAGKAQAILETLESRKYNGWTNYATWLVALHINNDQELQSEAGEVTRVGLNSRSPMASELTHVGYVGELLKDMVEQWFDGITDGGNWDSVNMFAADMLGGSLADVDWRSIAEHYITAVTESEVQS